MSRRLIIDELEFEVPYGKLAAKTYHEETDECKRILALHGWMDNSGSFDHMMPHLKHKDGLYVVCLDLPGHGRSSQLPPGSSYTDLHIVTEIRRCLTELNWIQPMKKDSNTNGNVQIENNDLKRKKFSIVGHSMGGGIGLYYASLFPDDVEEVVMIDFLKSRTFPTYEQTLQTTATTIDDYLNTVPSKSPFSSPATSRSTISTKSPKNPDKGQVVVSQETAIIATIDGHIPMGKISRDDAICLLKRSTVAVSTPPNSVIYSRDLRLQSMLNLRENIEINKCMFAGVKCNVFAIISKNGLYAGEDFIHHADTMEEFLKARAKNFSLQWIDADHYIHMTFPKKTADIINKFLDSPQDYKVFKDY